MESIHSQIVDDHNKHIIKPPSFTSHAIKKYFKTRVSSLFVPREELAQYSSQEIYNPFKPLTELNRRQWSFFLVGFLGWTWDAFDFFTVSLNVHNIADSFDKTVKQVTWGITLVLMLRSVGAFIFGILSDRIGRKYTYIANLTLLTILQIGCGFVQTYEQFLGVRAIFGIAMGGLFGLAAATALDDCPKAARGVISGMFQQGYAFGYLLVVCFQRAITDNSPHTWRALFWFSAGPPVLFIIWRLCLPETDAYLLQKAKLKSAKERGQVETKKFYQLSDSSKKAVKTYWLMFIYCIILMSGFNFMSHGSQDLYPTLLTVQLNYGKDRSTVVNSVANLGAMFGGFVFGHFSTFVGRRLSVIIGCIVGGALIYPWAFVRNSGINAGVFFLQACVQGCWGVIPIHLSELSPPQYRAFITGLSYQLGNLCSSASSTIEATIGERFPLSGEEGDYDYAKTMAIFMGCVFAFVLIVTFLGPENRGAEFDIDRDEELDVVNKDDELDSSDDEVTDTKGNVRTVERV